MNAHIGKTTLERRCLLPVIMDKIGRSVEWVKASTGPVVTGHEPASQI